MPGGWYPEDAEEIRTLVSEWIKGQHNYGAFAVMTPHAGWCFSGDLAARAVWALRECDTAVVMGGHLGRGDPILFAQEERFDCTVRTAENDLELVRSIEKELREVGIKESAPDRNVDNSVEILLPLAALRFPNAKIVWLRVPPDYKARELGFALVRSASSSQKNLAVIASTDLTHYGPNYGFVPHGEGEKAIAWVREENDRGFIRAVLGMDADEALKHARDRFSACSAGSAAAAISYALEQGAKRSMLIGHKLSCDVHPDRSFVGYAAIAFME